MKTQWICTWSLIPGEEEYVEKYSSEGEAKIAAVRLIAENFELTPYLDRMRKEEDPDYHEAADYLEKFLSCLSFSEYAENTLPCLSGMVECYSSEEEFNWTYDGLACPFLSARMSHIDGEPGLFVGVCLQNPPKAKTPQITGINIHIVEQINYGTSAYPLMVWNALQEEPQTHEQLIDSIWQQYNTVIERKAVGRHLKLLENLGFPLLHNSEGYYRSGAFREPKADVKYRPSSYPLMILQVLDGTDKTQAEIIRAVQGKYGIKLDRRAVKRNLELLQAFFFCIQKNKDGYSVQK